MTSQAYDPDSTPELESMGAGQSWEHSFDPPSNPNPIGETYTDPETGLPTYVQAADNPASRVADAKES